MKDMIVAAEKGRENGELLIIENIDKIAMAEIMKISSVIEFGNKYSWTISNADIDAAGDSKLTDIKKY